jgi:hypothetical protein
MENWIHEISKSYISSFSPKRKDLMENYVSLNEEQKLELFSQNVHSYLQEQFKNAFGFDINELSEENIESFLSMLLEYKGAEEVAARTKKAGGDSETAKQTRTRRLDKAARLSQPSVQTHGYAPTEAVPTDATYVGHGWMTADDRYISRHVSWPPIPRPISSHVSDKTGAPAPLTMKNKRTEHRLDAAQRGDDALRFAKRGDPAAEPTRQGAERSEELAKKLSGELKGTRKR